MKTTESHERDIDTEDQESVDSWDALLASGPDNANADWKAIAIQQEADRRA